MTKSAFKKYCVWSRLHLAGSEWKMTVVSVKGRTQKEAQRNTVRGFRHVGLSDISLLAVLEGEVPDDS